MSFHVGQKVVCVDDSSWQSWGTIRSGQIYTIAALAVNQGRPSLHLEEVESIAGCAYFASRFRPLVEDRKSVSFTIGADPDSDRWDNRKKRKEKV